MYCENLHIQISKISSEEEGGMERGKKLGRMKIEFHF